MSLSPVPAPRPTRVWLARVIALLLLSFGAGAVTSIAPALVTVAHSSDDEPAPSEVEAEKAEEAEEARERAEEQAKEHDPEYAVAPAPLSARTAQATAPTITRDAATPVPARQAAQPIKAGTTTTTTTPLANRAPVQEPGTPSSTPQAALPGLTLAADSSPAREAEGKVASAAPSVVGETVSRVLYLGGAGLLLLLALYGAAYRGARSLRLPSS